MIPLAQKIEQLKVRYQGEVTMPPHEVLGLIEDLRVLAVQEQARITTLGQAQIHLDGRIHAVERLAASYNPDARGR